MVAAWFGLAGGMVEGAEYWALAKLGWLSLNEALVDAGPEQIWVSAAFNLILFTALALPLWLAARAVPVEHRPAVFLGVFTFLSTFNLFALPDRLQLRGAFVLALGMSVQITRRAARDPAAALARLRLMLPAAAALAALLCAGITGGRRLHERWVESQLGAADAGAPNVLLIVLDTLRADHLSSYGYPRKTSPHLDQLAAEGVLFERAYSSSSWTLPSHASLMTGRYTFEHRADGRMTGRMLDTRLPTLAEIFSARGYRTGGFASNVAWASPRTGLARGFQHYDNLYANLTDMSARTFYGRFLRRYIHRYLFRLPRYPRRASHEITRAFLEWRDQDSQRPYFSFLNLMDVHDPRFSLPPHRGKFTGETSLPGGESPATLWKLTPRQAADRQEMIGEYDSALAYQDAQLGALFEALKQRGEWERTIVMVTSDHGELFGEHGLFDHGNGVHHAVVHVPMVLRFGDRLRRGVRVAAQVSQCDAGATLLELAGAAGTVLFGGTSLAPLWSNAPVPPEARAVLSEVDKAAIAKIPAEWPVRRGWVKTVITGRWQLILREDGAMELYDLKNAPHQVRNLRAVREHRAEIERLMELLTSQVAEARPAAEKALKGLQ